MNIFQKMALPALALLTLGACRNHAPKPETHQHEAGATAHSGEHVYACPMHPEVTGKEGDTCPKCGMALEHNDNAGVDLPVKIDFKTDPAALEAGRSATLSFTPHRTDDPAAAVPLDLQHDKKIHLIVVSDDLAYFEHLHPEYQADGSYQIKVLAATTPFTNGAGHNETYFRTGGHYTLFADYLPTGGQHKVDRFELNVGGKPAPAKSFTAARLTATSGAYTLTLEPAGALVAGQPAHIKGVLKKDGKVLDAGTLPNYLGAKAHAVVIGLATKTYLHVHPEVSGGAYDLHTTFDQPGFYRAWIQFNSGEKIETLDFVLEVKAAN